MGYEVIVVASDWKHPMERKSGDRRPREWSGNSSDFRNIARFPCDLEDLREEQERWDAERSLWVLGRHPDQKSGGLLKVRRIHRLGRRKTDGRRVSAQMDRGGKDPLGVLEHLRGRNRKPKLPHR